MSTCWTPTDHCYDGSCDGQRVSPHYPTMPDFVHVYDTGVRNSGWTRWERKLWRAARTAALWRWFPTRTSGEPPIFVVEKGLVRGDYPDNGITLDHFKTAPGYGANSYGGFGLSKPANPADAEFSLDAWSHSRGFALINDAEIEKAFASRVKGRLTGVLCHEIGHAFGFGHGGSGIMESVVNPPYYPDTFELAAFTRYWGRP